MNGTARHRAAIIITLVVITMIFPWPAQAAARPASSSSLHPSSVQDDYNAAWNRLETYLKGLQAINGQVSSADAAPVVASLNEALDRLDQAKVALDKHTGTGDSQASANISQANVIMDEVDPAYKALQTQAAHARLMNYATWIGGIVLACAGVILLLWIKKRHDKKKLRAFLDAKIDYSGMDSKPEGE